MAFSSIDLETGTSFNDLVFAIIDGSCYLLRLELSSIDSFKALITPFSCTLLIFKSGSSSLSNSLATGLIFLSNLGLFSPFSVFGLGSAGATSFLTF